MSKKTVRFDVFENSKFTCTLQILRKIQNIKKNIVLLLNIVLLVEQNVCNNKLIIKCVFMLNESMLLVYNKKN